MAVDTPAPGQNATPPLNMLVLSFELSLRWLSQIHVSSVNARTGIGGTGPMRRLVTWLSAHKEFGYGSYTGSKSGRYSFTQHACPEFPLPNLDGIRVRQ